MKQKQQMNLDGVIYTVNAKSIQMACEHGSQFVFYGRTPTLHDIQALHYIFELGIRQQQRNNKEAFVDFKQALGL